MTVRSKFKISTVAEFSASLVKFFKLPYGTQLRLYDTTTERQVRSDKTFKRKGINKKNKQTFLSNGGQFNNVTDLRTFAISIITVELGANQTFRLYAPDGSLLRGNVLLSNVKALLPNVIEGDNASELLTFYNIMATCSGVDLTVRQMGQIFNKLNEETNGDFAEILEDLDVD
jgi:hypothetical protein